MFNGLDPDQDPHSVQTVCIVYQQQTNIHYSAVYNAMFGVHMNYVLEEQFYQRITGICLWSFSYNSFVKFYGKKIGKPEHNCFISKFIIESQHDISKNVVCATSKGSDQPAHMRSLIRAFASRLHIL